MAHKLPARFVMPTVGREIISQVFARIVERDSPRDGLAVEESGYFVSAWSESERVAKLRMRRSPIPVIGGYDFGLDRTIGDNVSTLSACAENSSPVGRTRNRARLQSARLTISYRPARYSREGREHGGIDQHSERLVETADQVLARKELTPVLPPTAASTWRAEWLESGSRDAAHEDRREKSRHIVTCRRRRQRQHSNDRRRFPPSARELLDMVRPFLFAAREKSVSDAGIERRGTRFP